MAHLSAAGGCSPHKVAPGCCRNAAGVSDWHMHATDEGVRCAPTEGVRAWQIWTAAAADTESAETPLMAVLSIEVLLAPG
jgi:hypothetical protein